MQYTMQPKHLLIAAALASLRALSTAQTLPAPPVSPVPVVNFEYDAQGNPTKTTAAPGVPTLNLQTTTSYDRRKRPAAPPSQLANGLLERRGSSASIFEFRQVGSLSRVSLSPSCGV
jgi:hypothetical protein